MDTVYELSVLSPMNSVMVVYMRFIKKKNGSIELVLLSPIQKKAVFLHYNYRKNIRLKKILKYFHLA